MANFKKGDLLVAISEFRVDDELTNPTAVTFSTSLDGAAATDYVYGTDPEVTRTSTGIYRFEVSLDSDGVWDVCAWSTGTAQGVQQKTIVVKPSIADS